MIKNMFVEFWRSKELEAGRILTVSEVSRGAKISRQTLTKLRAGHGQKFDKNTLDALCKYFNVEPGPVPFLIYSPDD